MSVTSPTQKANTIEMLRKVCKPLPLKGKELDAFFIETCDGRDPNRDARQNLWVSLENNPVRLLFYGHMGCGKSTELNKFLDEHKDDLFPVKFSVLDTMTPSNVRTDDLILVITEQVLKAATEAKLNVDETSLKNVERYFDEQILTDKQTRDYILDGEAGLSNKTSLLAKIVGIYAKFSAEVKLNSSHEAAVIHKLRQRPGDLIAQANMVLLSVQNCLKNKKLLVVVEDIDKLDLKLAREMYVENVNLLTSLTTNIIYTIPIWLFHSPDAGVFTPRFDNVIGLPMIKVFDPKTGQALGHTIMRQIVLQRVEENMFADGVLDRLIEKTGGVPRHVFEVLNTIATMRNSTIPIGNEQLDYGLAQLRKVCLQQIALPYDPMRGGPESVEDLYYRLEEYARQQRKGEKPQPKSDPINQILLKTCALVEYNGEGWFGVHPLIIEALEQMGRLAPDEQ